MESLPVSINRLLIQEDIEGFIAAGAPMDEYKNEAEQIADAIFAMARAEISDQTILALITIIWMRNMDLSHEEIAPRLPSLRRVALEVSRMVE